MLYIVSYEIGRTGQENILDTMPVEAVSKQRALEYAVHLLEEQYPGEDDFLLLECTARRPGRPRQYGERKRVSLTLSTALIAALDARRGSESQSVYIEKALRKAWGMAPMQEQQQ